MAFQVEFDDFQVEFNDCQVEALISVLKFIGDDKISSSKINPIVSLNLSKGKYVKLSLLIFKLL